MIVSFPTPPAGPDQAFYIQTLEIIRRAFVDALSQAEATPRVLLRAPSGATFELTVDDTGALQLAENDGKTRP